MLKSPPHRFILFGLSLVVLMLVLAGCGGNAAPAPAQDDAAPPSDSDAPSSGDTDEGNQEQPDQGNGSSGSQGQEPTDPWVCGETNPHPIGQQIAETNNLTYEEVMTWFCSGDTFDDILIAIQTSELTDVPVEDLLDRNHEIGWDAVWQELGLSE